MYTNTRTHTVGVHYRFRNRTGSLKHRNNMQDICGSVRNCVDSTVHNEDYIIINYTDLLMMSQENALHNSSIHDFFLFQCSLRFPPIFQCEDLHNQVKNNHSFCSRYLYRTLLLIVLVMHSNDHLMAAHYIKNIFYAA